MKFQKLHLCSRRIAHYCTTNNANWCKPAGTETDFFLHHTITKEKVPFVIKHNNCISWYVCGPTVYDSAHIGHASTYMKFDIIRRILQNYTNKSIVQAMCITNIDDKIIARSAETGLHWEVLTKTYEKEFFADLASLNIAKPTIIARATDYIPQMIRFIEQLIKKNLAYRSADGSVYFDLQKYAKSGKFRTVDVSQPSIEFKKCASDFALWKAAKPSEPFWQSPWGPGRPGWHIECSAIASEYFGDSIDIHSGGYDLIFPHHENEETQCCAYHGVDQWVNYWIHSGQLYLAKDNEKMSKSLKNTISIQNLLRSYSHNHFRMLCFMMNYRTNVEFCDELMITSIKYCTKFVNFFNDCVTYINGYSDKGDIDESKLLQILDETKHKVIKAVQDDFNTEVCLSHLLHLVNETNAMLFPDSGNRNPVAVSLVYQFIRDTLSGFGFSFTDATVTADSKLESKLEAVINTTVTFRDKVRETALHCRKNKTSLENGSSELLKLCDQVRQEFQCQGIVIKDIKNNRSTWTYSDQKNET